jgi:hypothetical protein
MNPRPNSAAISRCRGRCALPWPKPVRRCRCNILPVDWMPGHGQFLIWIRRYGLALVEKGITVAAGKLHQVAKEAQREWTADDAIRSASGVMARTQEKEREQQRSADDGKSYPLGQQEDQPVEAGNQATSTK